MGFREQHLGAEEFLAAKAGTSEVLKEAGHSRGVTTVEALVLQASAHVLATDTDSVYGRELAIAMGADNSTVDLVLKRFKHEFGLFDSHTETREEWRLLYEPTEFGSRVLALYPTPEQPEE